MRCEEGRTEEKRRKKGAELRGANEVKKWQNGGCLSHTLPPYESNRNDFVVVFFAFQCGWRERKV